MRHGPAEPAGLEGDAARRLTAEGREQVRRAAAALARIVPRTERIWSSPLVRARETAELLAEAFGASAPAATPLLAPGFDCFRLAAELAEAGTGPFALVAHAPDVAEFTEWLIGAGGPGGIKFGSGAAAVVTLAPPGAGVLHALYPLETFQNASSPLLAQQGRGG
jgi:phosphohistidine phosphatase